MKSTFSIILLLYSASVFCQTTLYNEEVMAKHIQNRMLPLFSYSGTWHVTAKEWTEGRDTIFFKGTAKSAIQLNENVRQDSASVKFAFQWDSKFAEDYSDISEATFEYDFRSDRYTTVILRRPKNGSWFASYYSTTNGEFHNPLMFYDDEVKAKRKPKIFCQWTFAKHKLTIELHEARLDDNIRMRILEFNRQF